MVGFFRKMVEYVFGRGGKGAEAIRYIIVGALTTFVNLALFALMTQVINIEVTISNLTSISISILFAYVANKLVVFRQRSGSFAALAFEFIAFIGSRLFTMALDVGIVYVFYYILERDALFGKAVAAVLVVIANYIISKVIVFRKPRKNDNK